MAGTKSPSGAAGKSGGTRKTAAAAKAAKPAKAAKKTTGTAALSKDAKNAKDAKDAKKKPSGTAAKKKTAAAKPPVRKTAKATFASAAAKARTTAARAGGNRATAIRHWSSRRGRAALLLLRTLAALLLSLCAVEIFRLTLTPSPASVGIAHANLHPLATIRLYLRYGSLREQILEIGGNILIGVPMGFLLPQITPRLRGLLRVVLVTCVFITLIELTQWLFVRGRAFDVDDIICAAVGAAIGYLPLGRMFGMRLHPYHLHWWQRQLRRRRGTREVTPDDPAPVRSRARSRVYSGVRGGRSSRSAAAAAPRRAGRDS